MEYKLSKRKPASKGRTAAAKSAPKRQRKATDNSEMALAALMALLHADRWLFEAGEFVKKGGLSGELGNFEDIRLSIVQSLNRLQPSAYGALERTAGH